MEAHRQCGLEPGDMPSGNERHVGYQLKVLDHMIKKQMQVMMRENGLESVPLMHVWIIEYLAHNAERDIYQKDIEKVFRIGKSTLAATLKTMEEKGYIIRSGVQGDARLKKVRITEEGFACREQMARAKESLEEKVADGLSQEELDTFFRVIRSMQANLNT